MCRRTLRRALWLSTAIQMSFLTNAAIAQSEIPTELNEITVEAERTVVSGPSNQNSIDFSSERLERENPSDLQDVFKSEPSITVGSSIPASQKLYVNGVEETNLNVTIDGGRQNNKIFHHNATTIVDPSLLKAVRVDPSVAPADAGPGALAGSVAYETKDVADLLDPEKNFGGFVTGEYESNGSVFSKSASLYGRAGGFEALTFLKFSDGGVRNDGDSATIIGSGTNLSSGLAKFAYQSETGNRYEFSFERVIDDEQRPYRADIGRIIGGRPVPLTRNYDLDRQNIVFSYTNEKADGWWDPEVTLAYSVTDLALLEDTQQSFGTTNSLNGKFQNRFAVGTGTITAGLDFYSDSAELDYRFLANAAFNEAGTEKAQNTGLFVQARLEPNEKTRVSFGARADHQRFEGIDGTKSNSSGLSGNLSGEYDLTENLTINAGLSHVWGGVALAENFIINPAWTYAAGGITPVTSDNIFLGFDAALGNWDLGGKVFQTELNDVRTPSYRGGPNLTTDVRARGFELGAGYNWGTGSARIAYANIDTDINGRTTDSFTGRYLVAPIGEVITLEVVQNFDDKGLKIGANGQIVLKETDTFDADTNGVGLTLPSYQVFNAFVEYKPKRMPNLTIRGELSNIFDEAYANRGTYGQEYNGVVALNEPGRSIKITGTINF